MHKEVLARRATVREVAAAAEVSIATVSRVINGHGTVAPSTRDAVLRAVERLGAPGPLPRPRPEPRGAVFVRCPYLLTDYFGVIVSSLVEALELHDRSVLLDAGESRQGIGTLSALPERTDVAGAVLILPPENGEDLVELRRRGFPFVVVDPRTPPPPDIAAVSAAHLGGASVLTRHLLELGHRRIATIGGPLEWVAGNDRLAGHTAAMARHGLMPPAELALHVEPTMHAGYQAACVLLDLPDRPTAIVAFNDKIAVGALRAAGERGLEVPSDLSVVGFDDSDIATACTPQLTTVRQPLAEMGRIAVGLLIRLLAHQKLDALHIELATELVVRGSSGRPPQQPSAAL